MNFNADFPRCRLIDVIYLSICLSCFAIILFGCDPLASPISGLNNQVIRPQAIVQISDSLFAVSDVAYQQGKWESGQVYFLDIHQAKILGTFTTPQVNPQKLIIHQGYLYILSSGYFDLNTLVSTSSSISRLKIQDILDKPDQIMSADHDSFLLQDSLLQTSYFVDLQIHQNHLYFSSGISPVIYRMPISAFDQSQSLNINTGLLEAIDSKITQDNSSLALISMAISKDRLFALNFNEDQLSVYDLSKDQVKKYPCSIDLGEFPQEMEGSQNPIILEDELYFFMGLSGRLRKLNLKKIDFEDPNCQNQSEFKNLPLILGQVPNQMFFKGDIGTVVLSGEQEIWQFPIDQANQLRKYILPKGSQPWHCLWIEAQQISESTDMICSLWQSGKMAVISQMQSDQPDYQYMDLSKLKAERLKVNQVQAQAQALKLLSESQQIAQKIEFEIEFETPFDLLVDSNQVRVIQLEYAQSIEVSDQLKESLMLNPFLLQSLSLFQIETQLEIHGISLYSSEKSSLQPSQIEKIKIENQQQTLSLKSNQWVGIDDQKQIINLYQTQNPKPQNPKSAKLKITLEKPSESMLSLPLKQAYQELNQNFKDLALLKSLNIDIQLKSIE
jgi:hypothetical protein